MLRDFLRCVNDAKTRVKEMDFREVKRAGIDAGEKLPWWTFAKTNGMGTRHLPGAVHLGKGSSSGTIEQAVPDQSAPLVLYCGGGFRSGTRRGQLADKWANTNCIRWTAVGAPARQDIPPKKP